MNNLFTGLINENISWKLATSPSIPENLSSGVAVGAQTVYNQKQSERRNLYTNILNNCYAENEKLVANNKSIYQYEKKLKIKIKNKLM